MRNYELSADSDIHKRCCPLCFQAYSDFELTAVVPCWHCRDKIPLAQAIAIGASVSVPSEDRPTAEIGAADDEGMINFLLGQVDLITATQEAIKREAEEICADAESTHQMKVSANSKAGAYARDQIPAVTELRRRADLIRAGREDEFFEGILQESRDRQRRLAPAKKRQNRVHAQTRLTELSRMLRHYCGDTYSLWIKKYPPQIHCNRCGVTYTLEVSPEIAARKAVESIVSSRESRNQIYEFIEAHSEHTGKSIPKSLLMTRAGGWWY